MKIISYLWNKLEEKYMVRNMMIFLAFIFFIAIFFAPSFIFGVSFVIYFIAYIYATLTFDMLEQ